MIELNKIYNEDCVSLMGKMDDDSIDCVVTSPPYFNLRDYGADGQIGNEKTPWDYIGRMSDMFREVYRVLKPTGTVWLNLGDTYSSKEYVDGGVRIKRKDMVGIPWMTAFALRDLGFYIRQDIIWERGNAMPESVTDRCVKSHEYIFLLSKSDKYYFDHRAIQEPAKTFENRPYGVVREREFGYDTKKKNNPDAYMIPKTKINIDGKKYGLNDDGHFSTHPKRAEGLPDEQYMVRNKRDVWHVNTKPFLDAHFATYPPELIRPCILAGCPPNGVVYDPFMGDGTTALVTLQVGDRSFVGSEINPEYCKLANDRIMPHMMQMSLF